MVRARWWRKSLPRVADIGPAGTTHLRQFSDQIPLDRRHRLGHIVHLASDAGRLVHLGPHRLGIGPAAPPGDPAVRLGLIVPFVATSGAAPRRTRSTRLFPRTSRVGSPGGKPPSYFQSLEHLLRYCARPPFALDRLSVSRGAGGRITRIRYVLPRHKAANWVGPGRGRKSTRPGAKGGVELSPFEFLDRLADLVPPADRGELVQVHDDRDVFQESTDVLPAIDIHSLWPVPDARHRSPGAADWKKVCAEGRKSPSRRGEWCFGAPPPGAQAALPEAHESLISPETVAEVPLTGLSLSRTGRETGVSSRGTVAGDRLP